MGGILYVLCTCGGVLLVKVIDSYPAEIDPNDKLEYERTCTVECNDCKKVLSGQKYD